MTDSEIDDFKTMLLAGPHNRQLRASAYVKRLREQGLNLIAQLEEERKSRNPEPSDTGKVGSAFRFAPNGFAKW